MSWEILAYLNFRPVCNAADSKTSSNRLAGTRFLYLAKSSRIEVSNSSMIN